MYKGATLKATSFLERLLSEGEYETILEEIHRIALVVHQNQDIEQMKSFIQVLAERRDLTEVKDYTLI